MQYMHAIIIATSIPEFTVYVAFSRVYFRRQDRIFFRIREPVVPIKICLGAEARSAEGVPEDALSPVWGPEAMSQTPRRIFEIYAQICSLWCFCLHLSILGRYSRQISRVDLWRRYV